MKPSNGGGLLKDNGCIGKELAKWCMNGVCARRVLKGDNSYFKSTPICDFTGSQMVVFLFWERQYFFRVY